MRVSIYGLTPENKLYFIEANPNPILAADEDFAQSAMKADLTYPRVDRADHPGRLENGARLARVGEHSAATTAAQIISSRRYSRRAAQRILAAIKRR
jgi:hypothetical protein